jgi:8-oxo-dGTP pyrophosphatase MutT (NUDIX family)
MSAPRLRPAVRALVVDDEGRFLLVRLSYPHGAWWVLPGGGLDDGEDDETALRRELREEIGLDECEVDAIVWRRVHEFDFVDATGARWGGQRETVHLVRVGRFEPRPQMTAEELRAENLDTIRWWTTGEVSGYVGPDSFAPPDIASLVHAVIANGPAAVPPDLHQRD